MSGRRQVLAVLLVVVVLLPFGLVGLGGSVGYGTVELVVWLVVVVALVVALLTWGRGPRDVRGARGRTRG
ncbi:hypothetical protein [Aeromicrobium erythreum]|uniref:Uncharacterized protein n=1 Tax=Aeromicrobium erythreum TaxID=2041 RepID=A0A0U3SYL6_9ACTN|nr:hypothetical protein [Aeromicrobium erythreum]ALX03658.1 hypothetical protein AERYTH_02555 [Aeromicrobium erythreum]